MNSLVSRMDSVEGAPAEASRASRAQENLQGVCVFVCVYLMRAGGEGRWKGGEAAGGEGAGGGGRRQRRAVLHPRVLLLALRCARGSLRKCLAPTHLFAPPCPLLRTCSSRLNTCGVKPAKSTSSDWLLRTEPYSFSSTVSVWRKKASVSSTTSKCTTRWPLPGELPWDCRHSEEGKGVRGGGR